MLALLKPRPTLDAPEIERSQRLMVWEGFFAGGMYSLASGGFMAAYALALGANSLQVGVLAALPFIAQVIRLPAILLFERFRMRKALGLPALVVMQVAWAPIGAVPFIFDVPGPGAILAVIVLLALRGPFAAVWVTAETSWIRDLVTNDRMASYFGRRQSLATIGAVVAALGGSFFVEWWQGQAAPGDEVLAYSFLLIGGVVCLGLFSPLMVARTSEPLMPAAARSNRSALGILREPLQDGNFRHLLRFLSVWSFASNLAIPFFAVYMLTVMQLSLPFVVGMTILSQLASVLFVRVWGPLADRAGSKPVLSLSASLYLLVILGWLATAPTHGDIVSYPLLIGLHIFGGVAAAGVSLTANTLALKVAPEGKAVSYSGVAGIMANLGAGVGPILGGLLADFFLVRSLDFGLTWNTAESALALPSFGLMGFDFLFLGALLTGFLSLNLLVALREEGEVPRDAALAELMGDAGPMMRAVSSIPGLNMVSAFSYGYLRRVPGVDVAIGVTAHELAASTRAATSSALRGQAVARTLAGHVRETLNDAFDELDDAPEQGSALARQAARGALYAVDEIGEQLGLVAEGVIAGTLEALASRPTTAEDSIRASAHGLIEAALDGDQEIPPVVQAALSAAASAAQGAGIDQATASASAAQGAIDAAQAAGSEALTTVRQAIPDAVLPATECASSEKSEDSAG